MPNFTTSQGTAFYTNAHLGAKDVLNRNYDKDNGQAGMYAPSGQGWLTSATAMVGLGGRISRFVPSRSMTITNIAFVVAAWAAGDTANPNVDVGIYDATLTTKLASSGATAGKLNSTGLKTVSLTTPLAITPRTVYYAALSCAAIGTSTGTIAGASYGVSAAHTLFGATAGLIECDVGTSVHPLPATWTVNAGSGAGWVLALRES